MNENKGSISFIKNEPDVFEKKVGSYGAVPIQHLTFGTWGSVGKEVTTEQIEKLKERVADVEWQGDLEVHVNGSSIFKQLERLFDSDRKNSLFTRVLFGLPVTLLYGALGKVANYNYYNPYSETLQLYNENEYIGMARLGDAELIDNATGLKKEILSFVSTVPNPFIRIPTIFGIEKAYNKLDEEEKHVAEKYLGSSIMSGLAIDTLAVGGLLTAAQVALPVNPFVIAGGVALTTQAILEIRRRIKENRGKIFDRDNQLDLVEYATIKEVPNTKNLNLAT
jgi:hypothetical protein